MMEPLVSNATAPRSETALDSLSIKLIRRRLCTETIGFQIYLFHDVSSTNVVLRQLAAAGARPGVVVLAESQHAGRGRLGQVWFSPPGVNLYASILFRPRLAPSAVPVFTFIASLALSETIWAEGLPAGIKWPNDIVFGDRKVAGTLGTCTMRRGCVDALILGAGVNLNVTDDELRRALGPRAETATSLREATGRTIDRNAFAARLLNLVEKWFTLYCDRGPAIVLEAWRDRDVLTGRRVEVHARTSIHTGRAAGVDDEGRLQVEDEAGGCRRVVAGEILIRD